MLFLKLLLIVVFFYIQVRLKFKLLHQIVTKCFYPHVLTLYCHVSNWNALPPNPTHTYHQANIEHHKNTPHSQASIKAKAKQTTVCGCIFRHVLLKIQGFSLHNSTTQFLLSVASKN